MPKLHAEALVFALAWAALAIFGYVRAGYVAGALLSVGVLIAIMPASSAVLSKTGSFTLERQVRWGILLVAAAAFAAWLLLQSSSSS
ncbi:MAG: hypothetical protein ACT4N8_04675 [Sphingosinicella sp.]|uniref:hypothetical protein n=1 Tax=Sphingosinicella sp. TaxID=1917971 RepID=UPI004037687E